MPESDLDTPQLGHGATPDTARSDDEPKKPRDGEPLAEEVTPRVIRGEVREFLRSHEQRRRQVPRALLVGLLAGLLGVAFRQLLALGDNFRDHLIRFGHAYPAWGWALPIFFGAAGAGIAVFLVRRYAPEASGSGIPHLEAVLHRLHAMRWRRILPVKFAGGVVGIGSGLALGREGPTVQMGGAVGQMVSEWLGTTPRERQTLIAAGSAAGIAAAFNAPLAGVIFVLEEVQRDFSPSVFTASFIASVTSDVVTRLLTGQLPVFHVRTWPVPSLVSLPAFLVLGVIAGLLGVAFNRSLLGSLNWLARWPFPPWATAAIIGAGVGLTGWFWPDTLGGGHPLVESTLAGRVALEAIPFLFLLRFGLTMFSYGCGAPGGIFAPLLVLGAQIGLAVGKIGHHYFPRAIDHPEPFAVAGMAVYFAAIVRAPLTGIVLILEMTANYSLMLPLLVGCFAAYAVADLLGDTPVYEALLERNLLRSQENPELERALLLELSVEHGAPFEGKQVRELNLPPGCLLVSIDRGLGEEVPTPDSILTGGDRITAVIGRQAAGAAAMLKEGVEAGGG